MVQRQSTLFLPTLREDPADAEAVSHKLLVRAGLIRQLVTGLWTFLPAGWRVHEKIVQIIREEMNAIGGQEMFMPVLAPAELWQKTGRYPIPELLKVSDRGGREFVLVHDARGDDHVPCARAGLLPRAAEDPLPLPDEGARRAAAARRADPGARVRDEGRVLVRPRRRGPRRARSAPMPRPTRGCSSGAGSTSSPSRPSRE